MKEVISSLFNTALLRREQTEALMFDQGIPRLFAKDAMIKPVLLYPKDNTEKILGKLKKEHINACIVVSKEKKFIGEISDNDIIKLFLNQVKYEPLVKKLNHGYRREFLYKNAEEIANRHKLSVKKDTPINEVLKLLFREGVEYIPVINNAEKVVGVVTPSSLISLLKNY